jgi:chromosome segregation ATPase
MVYMVTNTQFNGYYVHPKGGITGLNSTQIDLKDQLYRSPTFQAFLANLGIPDVNDHRIEADCQNNPEFRPFGASQPISYQTLSANLTPDDISLMRQMLGLSDETSPAASTPRTPSPHSARTNSRSEGATRGQSGTCEHCASLTNRHIEQLLENANKDRELIRELSLSHIGIINRLIDSRQLHAPIDQRPIEHAQTHQSQIDALQAQVATLSRKIDILQAPAKAEVPNARVEELNAEVQKLTDYSQRLEAHLIDVGADRDDLASQLEDAHRNLHEVELTAESKIAALEDQIQQQQTKTQAIEQLLATLERAQAIDSDIASDRVGSLESRLGIALDALEKSNLDREREKADLEGQISWMHDALVLSRESLNDELESLRGELADREQRLECQGAEHTDALNTIRVQRGLIDQYIDRIQAGERSNQDLLQSTDDLNAELSKAWRNSLLLKEQLEALTSSSNTDIGQISERLHIMVQKNDQSEAELLQALTKIQILEEQSINARSLHVELHNLQANQYIALEQTNNELLDQIISLQDEYGSKNSEMNQRLESLASQLTNSLISDLENGEKVEALEAELANLRTFNSEQSVALTAQIASKEGELQIALQETDALQRNQQAAGILNQQLQEQIHSATDDNASLNKQLDTSQRNVDLLVQLIAKLQEDMEQTGINHSALLQETELKREDAQRQLDELTASSSIQTEELSTQLAEKAVQAAQLSRELDELRAQSEFDSEALSQIRSKEDELVRAKQSADMLIEELQTQILSAGAKDSDLSDQLKASQMQVDLLVLLIADLQKDMEQTGVDHAALLEETELKREDAQRQLDELTASSSIQTEELSTQFAEKAIQAAQLSRELDELRAQSGFDSEELSKLIALKEDEIRKTQQAAYILIEQLQAEIQSTTVHKESLSEQLAASQRNAEELAQALVRLQSEMEQSGVDHSEQLQKMQNALLLAQSQTKSLSAKADEIEGKAIEAQKYNTKMQELLAKHLQNADEEMAALDAKLVQSAVTADRLRNELVDLRAEATNLAEQVQSKEAELAKQRRLIDQLEDSNEQLQSTVEQMSKERSEGIKERERSLIKLGVANTKLKESAEREAQLQADLELMRNESAARGGVSEKQIAQKELEIKVARGESTKLRAQMGAGFAAVQIIEGLKRENSRNADRVNDLEASKRQLISQMQEEHESDLRMLMEASQAAEANTQLLFNELSQLDQAKKAVEKELAELKTNANLQSDADQEVIRSLVAKLSALDGKEEALIQAQRELEAATKSNIQLKQQLREQLDQLKEQTAVDLETLSSQFKLGIETLQNRHGIETETLLKRVQELQAASLEKETAGATRIAEQDAVIQSIRTDLARKEALISNLQEELDASSVNNDELQMSIEVLSGQMSDLNINVKQTATKLGLAKELLALSKRSEAALKRELEETSQASDEKIAEIKTRVNEELKAQRKIARGLEKDIMLLEHAELFTATAHLKAIANLKQELAATQKEMVANAAAHKIHLNELQRIRGLEREAFLSQIGDLEAQLLSKSTELADKSKEADELRLELQSATDKLTISEQKNARLEEELEATKGTLALTEKSLREKEEEAIRVSGEFERAIFGVEQENSKLKAKLLGEDALKFRIEQKEKDIEELHARIDELMADHEVELDQAKQFISHLQSEMNELRLAYKAKEKELSVLQSQLARLEKVEQKLELSQDDLETAKGELKAVKSGAVNDRNASNELREQLELKQRELEALQSSLQEKERTLKDASAQLSRIPMLTDLLSKTQAELESVQGDFGTLNANYNDRVTRMRALHESRLAEIEAENVASRKELELEIEGLKAKLNTVAILGNQIFADLESKSREHELLSRENLSLFGISEQTKAMKAEYEAKIEKLTAEIKGLQEQLALRDLEIVRLNRLLNQKGIELQTAKEELMAIPRLEAEITEEMVRAKELERSLASEADQSRTLRGSLDDASFHNDSLIAANRSLSERNEDLLARLAELESAKEDMRQLESEVMELRSLRKSAPAPLIDGESASSKPSRSEPLVSSAIENALRNAQSIRTVFDQLVAKNSGGETTSNALQLSRDLASIEGIAFMHKKGRPDIRSTKNIRVHFNGNPPYEFFANENGTPIWSADDGYISDPKKYGSKVIAGELESHMNKKRSKEELEKLFARLDNANLPEGRFYRYLKHNLTHSVILANNSNPLHNFADVFPTISGFLTTLDKLLRKKDKLNESESTIAAYTFYAALTYGVNALEKKVVSMLKNKNAEVSSATSNPYIYGELVLLKHLVSQVNIMDETQEMFKFRHLLETIEPMLRAVLLPPQEEAAAAGQ